jgi:hypothetical protein
MPKQPIAVELEDGETQVVRDSGLTVQGTCVQWKPAGWPGPPG